MIYAKSLQTFLQDGKNGRPKSAKSLRGADGEQETHMPSFPAFWIKKYYLFFTLYKALCRDHGRDDTS